MQFLKWLASRESPSASSLCVKCASPHLSSVKHERTRPPELWFNACLFSGYITPISSIAVLCQPCQIYGSCDCPRWGLIIFHYHQQQREAALCSMGDAQTSKAQRNVFLAWFWGGWRGSSGLGPNLVGFIVLWPADCLNNNNNHPTLGLHVHALWRPTCLFCFLLGGVLHMEFTSEHSRLQLLQKYEENPPVVNQC